MTDRQDEFYMRQALIEAKKAFDLGEVPVGAILVKDDEIIARSHNLKETKKDPTAHAEMLIIQAGIAYFEDWRLTDTTLYVTLEPCAMCASAISHARIRRLVVGALDFKMGGCGSALSVLNHEKLNHRVLYETGLLEGESTALLQQFFQMLRRRNKERKGALSCGQE